MWQGKTYLHSWKYTHLLFIVMYCHCISQAAAATVISNAHPPTTEQCSPAGFQARVVSVTVSELYRDEQARKKKNRNQRSYKAVSRLTQELEDLEN